MPESECTAYKELRDRETRAQAAWTSFLYRNQNRPKLSERAKRERQKEKMGAMSKIAKPACLTRRVSNLHVQRVNLPVISATAVVKPLFAKLMKIIPLALLFATALTVVAQSKPNYEIYAVQYATIPGFSVAELVAGADPARKIDIAMMIWLVRGNGRNIPVSYTHLDVYKRQGYREPCWISSCSPEIC